MTIFSSEQSAVFNQVRCTSKRMRETAVVIAREQTEAVGHQVRAKELANSTARKHEDVAWKMKKVARQQEKVAQEEAEASREQAEASREQAKASRDLAKASREQAEASRKQAEVSRKQVKIAHEQEVIAEEQAEIIHEQTEITEEQEEMVREQGAILDISNTIAELLSVGATLQTDVLDSLDCLDEYGALKPVLVEFESVIKTIFWGNNCSVQLTKRQYDMVEVLYHAPACQMPIADLEEKVWGEDKKMPTTDAAKMAVSRLNKKLKIANFPFEVLRTKCDLETVPVINPITRKVTVDFVVQPEIEVYELVRR